MENLVTSTMKIRTPSGEHVHHHHPYAVGRMDSHPTGTSTSAIHSAQQIGGGHVPNASDYNDLEFYSGPSSHDVITWKSVSASSGVGVLSSQVHPHHPSYGLPVNVSSVDRDPNGMEALAIRISTGNGSLGSRSDGTDLVIDDLISNPDEDEAMVPPMRSGGHSHRMIRDRSLSGEQPSTLSVANTREHHHNHIPIPAQEHRGSHAISNPLPIGSRRASAHHIRLSSIDEPSSSRFRVNEELSTVSKAMGDVSSTVSRPTGISTASAPPYLETKMETNLVNRNNKLNDTSVMGNSPHSTVSASSTAPLFSKLHAALTQPRPHPIQSTTQTVSQSNINCTRCGRELSSKCLMQTCIPTDETKCRRCGNELTTKCLLAMCLKNYPYN